MCDMLLNENEAIMFITVMKPDSGNKDNHFKIINCSTYHLRQQELNWTNPINVVFNEQNL